MPIDSTNSKGKSQRLQPSQPNTGPPVGAGGPIRVRLVQVRFLGEGGIKVRFLESVAGAGLILAPGYLLDLRRSECCRRSVGWQPERHCRRRFPLDLHNLESRVWLTETD